MKKIYLFCALLIVFQINASVHNNDLENFINRNYECLTVDTAKQKMSYYCAHKKIYEYDISTGENGLGQKNGSYKTPLGLHYIKKKVGIKSKIRSIFRGGVNTGEVYNPKHTVDQDLILTRVIYIEGLEKGWNNGYDKQGNLVDSYSRGILIHGTNQEDKIGSPASKGCIRMRNDDIIKFYNIINEGTIIWIF